MPDSEKQIEDRWRARVEDHGILTERVYIDGERGKFDVDCKRDGRIVEVETKRPGNGPSRHQLQRGRVLLRYNIPGIISDDEDEIVEFVLKTFREWGCIP